MARIVKPLTATQVLNAKSKDKTCKLFDGGGLYLLVTPSGGKHWKLKYRQLNGKETILSIGTYPDVSLEQARRKRDEARAQIAGGIDPGEAKRQEKAERTEANKNTFAFLATKWLELIETKISSRTMCNYKGILERSILPAIGDMHIKDVKAGDILGAVKKIEIQGKTATSKKACQLCSQVMQLGIAMGEIEIDPVPSLRILLKTHKVRHRSTILDPLELGKLLVRIDEYGQFKGYYPVKYALQIMPYVFVRTNELINARWEQINFETCEWRYTVSKTNTPHIVPLAPQVIAILEKLRMGTGGGQFLFPNMRDCTHPISEVTLVGAIRRMGYTSEEMSVHGFRATARTLLDEVLRERYDLIEHQLAHTVRDPNGRAYNRTQYLEDRKAMMNRWATYLDTLREKARPEMQEIPYTGRYLKEYMNEIQQ